MKNKILLICCVLCLVCTSTSVAGKLIWSTCGGSSSQFYLDDLKIRFSHNSPVSYIPITITSPLHRKCEIKLHSQHLYEGFVDTYTIYPARGKTETDSIEITVDKVARNATHPGNVNWVVLTIDHMTEGASNRKFPHFKRSLQYLDGKMNKLGPFNVTFGGPTGPEGIGVLMIRVTGPESFKINIGSQDFIEGFVLTRALSEHTRKTTGASSMSVKIVRILPSKPKTLIVEMMLH